MGFVDLPGEKSPFSKDTEIERSWREPALPVPVGQCVKNFEIILINLNFFLYLEF